MFLGVVSQKYQLKLLLNHETFQFYVIPAKEAVSQSALAGLKPCAT